MVFPSRDPHPHVWLVTPRARSSPAVRRRGPRLQFFQDVLTFFKRLCVMSLSCVTLGACSAVHHQYIAWALVSKFFRSAPSLSENAWSAGVVLACPWQIFPRSGTVFLASRVIRSSGIREYWHPVPDRLISFRRNSNLSRLPSAPRRGRSGPRRQRRQQAGGSMAAASQHDRGPKPQPGCHPNLNVTQTMKEVQGLGFALDQLRTMAC